MKGLAPSTHLNRPRRIGVDEGASPILAPPPKPKMEGETDNKVERIHYQKRRALFIPIGAKGLPQDKSLYTGLRRTLGTYANGQNFEINDNWITHDSPQRMLDEKWSGVSLFFLKDEPGGENEGASPIVAPPLEERPPPVPSGSGSEERPKTSVAKPTWKPLPDEVVTDQSGQKWKGDSIGRWYKLDASGSKAVKSTRPQDITSEAWSLMSYAEQKEAIEHYAKLRDKETKEARAFLEIIVKGATSSGGGASPTAGEGGDATGSGGASPAKPDGNALVCAPLGVLGFAPALMAKVLKWKRSTAKALVDLCTDNREREASVLDGADVVTDAPQPPP